MHCSFPLPDHIDQHAALNRWHRQVVQLNEDQPLKSRKRTLKDGREVDVAWKPRAVCANAKATGTRIVKQYVREYMRTVRILGLETATREGMPGLYTNSVEIAALRGCSDRTARSHLRTLQKVGLVSKYVWHGSRHDFEIWVNPDILWSPELQQALIKTAALTDMAAEDGLTVDNPVDEAVSQPASGTSQPRPIGEIVKNFPHKVTVNSMYIETENRKADGVEKHGDQITATPNSRRSEGEKAQNGEMRQRGAPEKERRGPGAADVDNPTQATQGAGIGSRLKARLYGTAAATDDSDDANRSAAQKQAILEGYVRSFWAYAGKMLYGARKFESWEEPYIIQAIRRGVYRDFQVQLTEKEWDQYQGELYRQIDMAARYYESNQAKWVPDPYARRVAGTGYFDAENLRGFNRTRQWLRDNQKYYRRDYVTTRINAAIRQLRQHQAGTAPQKIQAKSYLGAYQYLQEQMSRYGQQAVDRFNELAASLSQTSHPRSDAFRTRPKP